MKDCEYINYNECRDIFMEQIYEELADQPDNYLANQIITIFDLLPKISMESVDCADCGTERR